MEETLLKKTALLSLVLALSLSSTLAARAAEVNMDVPYGDREPGGYQHLTVNYHNYWRHHHHPWSNIEAERHVVREAQDLAKQTKIWEGDPRKNFVRADDSTIRERFNTYMFTSNSQGEFNPKLPDYFIEQVKNRPSVDETAQSNIHMNSILPENVSYNDLTYMPDTFTKKQLRMPELRYKSALFGNDLILYDTVTGRVRGVWRDVISQ